MKFKIDNFLIAAMSVLILIACGLSTYFLANTDRRDVIEVELKGDNESFIAFDVLSLFPGDEVSYKVSIGHKEVKDGTITVNFSEEGEGALNEFLNVRIVSEGETLSDMPLTDLLTKSDGLVFAVKSKRDLDLEVIYYLPLDVGNDAMGASSGFMLSIKASKE